MSVAGVPSLAHEARAAESTPRNQALQALETPQFLSPPRGAAAGRRAVVGARRVGRRGPNPASGFLGAFAERPKGVLMCDERARDVVRR